MDKVIREGVVRVGVDLAKQVIQVHAVDAHGRVVVAKALSRGKFLGWCAGLPANCVVAMEACSGAHDWARKLNALGVLMIDLTPAAIGPYCVPPVNLKEHVGKAEMNVNMVTCGGQATIPMVYAVSRAVEAQGGVPYAEIVASVSSASAGPGTRANIDEFTKTTSAGVRDIGGAARGKTIIILNPAEPPMIMRDTIFCAIPEDADHDAITRSIKDVVADVQTYVPGYRLLNEPQFDEPSVVIVAVLVYPTGLMPQPTENSLNWWLVRGLWVLILTVVTAFEMVVLLRLGRIFAAPLPTIPVRWSPAVTDAALFLGVAMASYGITFVSAGGFAPDGHFPWHSMIIFAVGAVLVSLTPRLRSVAEQPGSGRGSVQLAE